MIFIDQENKEMMFLILNMIPASAAEEIEKRMGCFSISLTRKNCIPSFDLLS